MSLFPSSWGQARRRFLCRASPYHASWPVCSAESPLWANVCFRPFTPCLTTESCLQLWEVQHLHRSSQRDLNPLETCAARRTCRSGVISTPSYPNRTCGFPAYGSPPDQRFRAAAGANPAECFWWRSVSVIRPMFFHMRLVSLKFHQPLPVRPVTLDRRRRRMKPSNDPKGSEYRLRTSLKYPNHPPR